MGNKVEFKIGNKTIGNGRVLIQSMSTYLPSQTRKCIKELKELEKAGADILRVAIKTKKDANKIKILKKNIDVPLVGDIHFNYDLGIRAIHSGIDKIRFNPGNIGSDDNLNKLIKECIKHDIPVRIGVNSGSIEKSIDQRENLTRVEKCILSLRKYVSKCEELGLKKMVLSIKMSGVDETIEAYRKADYEFNYPLHIGLTEAGIGINAITKSTIAIGTLLKEGVGDTIRVSLTGDPVQEVKVAKSILCAVGLSNSPNLISCPTCGRCMVNLEKYALEVQKYIEPLKGKINVAVMGCPVNGLGEGKEADIGIAFLKSQAVLFKKGVQIDRGPIKKMLKALKEGINDLLNIDQDNSSTQAK